MGKHRYVECLLYIRRAYNDVIIRASRNACCLAFLGVVGCLNVPNLPNTINNQPH